MDQTAAEAARAVAAAAPMSQFFRLINISCSPWIQNEDREQLPIHADQSMQKPCKAGCTTGKELLRIAACCEVQVTSPARLFTLAS
jgi:hypothetical protein